MKNSKLLFITSFLFIPLLSFGDCTSNVTVKAGSYEYYCSAGTHPPVDQCWCGQIKVCNEGVKDGSPYCKYQEYSILGSTCPTGYSYDSVTNVCTPPLPLNTYDNDPQGCSKNGGYFMSTGTEQVGGTTYGASFFGGSGIQLGGSLKATTKCGTLGDLAGQMVTTALSFVPFASKLFGSDGMKKLANIAWIDKLQKYNQSGGFADLPNTPKGFNDTSVGLPRIGATSNTGKPNVPISETAVPSSIKIGDTNPTRAPTITADAGYEFIKNAHIPSRANGDIVFDQSVVQLVNDFNAVSRELTLKYQSDPVAYAHLAPSSTRAPTALTQVIPKTFTYTAPVKETVDFSSMVSGGYNPINIANYTGQTTLSKTIEGTTPVDTYNTTKTFPDGSSSFQSVRIVPSTNSGSMKTTTLSPDGISNTTTVPIQTTNYVSPTTQTVPEGVTIQTVPDAPVASTNSTPATPVTITNPDSTTTTVFPDGSTVIKDTSGTTISSTPATITTPANSTINQDASTIINAVMPDYSFPSLSEFIPFDSNPITEMIAGADLMFTNIRSQISSTTTVFDNTKTLLEGGWTPPVIPSGACGDSLAFNFHGKRIDLCPPLVNSTAIGAPIVEPVVTIGGMILSVTIILGGF